MENKISVVIADNNYSAILQQIDSLDAALPFLINLSPEERAGGFKLGDKNLGFLEKGKDYLNQRPDFLPVHYSKEEVSKDAALAGQLATIARKLRVLADKVEDTASIAGMEALAGILAYYNAVRQATKDKVNGSQTIYDDLKKRFPGRPKSGTEEAKA
jgi:hypothetical protein